MKKFFSLVLALVMALSLTTVAWGVPGTAGSQSELETAITNAAAGDTITLTASFSVDAQINITKGITIDGAGYTITSSVSGSDTRAINIPLAEAGATVTIKNLTLVTSAERGINFYNNSIATPGTLVIDTVTIGNATTYPSYAINLTGNAKGSTVTISNSDITGLTALNVWGSDMTINATGTDFVGKDPSSAEAYNAVKLLNNGTTAAEGTVVTITGGSITAEGDSAVYSNATSTGVVNVSSTTTLVGNNGKVNVAVINYPNGYAYSFDTMAGANAYIEEQLALDPNAAITVNVLETAVNSGESFTPVAGVTYALPAGASVVPDGSGAFVAVPTASVPTSGSKEAYYTADFVNYAVQVGCDVVNNKYELKSYFGGSEQAKMFAQVAIWRTPKVLGGAQLDLYPYTVAVSADSATLAFVDGSNITYLNPNYSTWVGTATLVETVDFDDAEKCGDVFTKNDVAVYKDVAGKIYVENKNGNPYNVGGELVLLKAATEDSLTVKELAMSTASDFTNDVVYTVKHTYDYNVKALNGVQTVQSVFCSVCKDDFDFVAGTTADAIAKFKAGNFVDTGLKINGTTVVWAEKDGSYSAGGSVNLPVTLPSVGGTTSTDKVTSADTFDAGIAMYVGMSVMAAAGSAVVLKKRED